MRLLQKLACCLALTLFAGASALAQKSAPKQLIVDKVDENQLVTLRGNTPPAAIAKNDLGRVSSGMAMTDLILVLRRSPEMQAAFDAFVESQYELNSPNYHQWLTPEQIGEKFGPSLADIATVSAWLGSHGLSVDEVSKDRMTIRFSGSARQVEAAFHTELHNLTVNGEPHFSNMTDPQIPMALDPVVLGPKALSNFIPRPLHRRGGKVTLDNQTGKWQRVGQPTVVPAAAVNGIRPEIGFSCGTGCQIEDLTPNDFATIYNLTPLWNAGIDGTGQTIAIAGRSDVRATDVSSFRSTFGLSGGSFTTIHNGTDPGLCTAPNYTSTVFCTLDDQIENALDVEWAGATAPKATVDLVVTQQTKDNDAIYESAKYIIENNTAKIINVSYGNCELFMGTSGNTAYNSLWQSAAAAGIAVFVASGDAGSPGCDQSSGTSAQFGLAVSGLASTPYNTAVGGTDFDWGKTASPKWNTTNDPNNGSSAIGYVKEVTWNDSCTNPLVLSYLQSAAKFLRDNGFPSATNPTDAESACNFVENWWTTIDALTGGVDLSFFLQAIGAGGGASNCTTNSSDTVANPDPTSCSGGYAKPTWQAGVSGIPTDGKRDIPDVSFFAGNGLLGSAYLICVSDWATSAGTTCVTKPYPANEPTVGEIGGTSAASPAMAGIMALINQKAGSTQGNPNSQLYSLAAKANGLCSAGTATTSNGCYFNDIDTNTIAMPCIKGTPNCNVSVSANAIGVLSGFAGATGFDNATGLGSLNVANVVNGWALSTGTATATVGVSANPTSFTSVQGTAVTVTVTGSSGTPTGTIVLTSGSFTSASKSLASGTVTFNLSPGALAVGTDTITATYSGDPVYAGNTGTTQVTVTAAPVPTVTVSPSSNTIIVNQSLSVPVTVTGANGTATGTVTLSGGGYTSSSQSLASGSTTFNIPANSLTTGSVTLTANYSGDTTYATASGTASITVNSLPAPSVTVTPASSGINSGQSLNVTATVAGAPTPTGSVTLKSGSYTSSAQTLASGSATIAIPANTLSAGTDTLTVTYSGDGNYGTATGTSSVTVTQSTYTLAATAPAAVSRGGGATSTITWATTNNYSANVTLSTCTLNTGSPSNSSADTPKCTLSTAAFGASGSGTATVTTKAATTAALQKPHIGGWAEAGSGAVLALLVFFGIPARRRGWRAMVGMVILLFTLGSLAACGGGGGSGGGNNNGGSSDPGTASGAYTFTVKATGADPAATTSTTTFTVTVN